MTSGIGNPDWQRRYNFSAVPLLSLTYNDIVNGNSGLQDSNGFPNLVITTQAGSSLVFSHVVVAWFQDSSGLVQIGTTDWTTPPQSQVSIKVPVAARYYTLSIGPVGGTTGHTIVATVYGTTSDEQNLLTQDTDIPLGHDNPTLGASAISTVMLAGIFGGRVYVSVDQNANNKWTSWLEYYDHSTQTWIQFWTIHGQDHGQSYNSDAVLPYAPVRINVRNDDTVSHVITWSVIAP